MELKKIKLASLLFLTVFFTVVECAHAQTATAISQTKISVDYSQVSDANLEIIAPDFMAGDARGFKPVEQEVLSIKGVVSSSVGILEFQLNEKNVELSSAGVFSTSVSLVEGENILTFDITDNNGAFVSKEYIINRSVKEDAFSVSRYYALIIGINDYEDPAITDLDEPINDAEALYKVLTEKYTFDPSLTKVLKNPTRDEIYDILDNLSLVVKENDNLLVFYAGHGHWDKEAEIGYWLPSDAHHNKKRDWMRNSALIEYMREIKSHHTLLITDACFGGSIFKTRKAFKDASMGIQKLHEVTSRKAMTSGTLNEVPDKSIFMKYLLKNLESNDEKYIASEQLFYSIKPAVMNNGQNTPQFGVMQSTGDEGGDFIFIKRE